MSSRPTRRSVSAVLLGVPALAQVRPAEAPKADAAAPPEDLRKAASERVQTTAERLRKFAIPMETEPAFRFRA